MPDDPVGEGDQDETHLQYLKRKRSVRSRSGRSASLTAEEALAANMWLKDQLKKCGLDLQKLEAALARRGSRREKATA